MNERPVLGELCPEVSIKETPQYTWNVDIDSLYFVPKAQAQGIQQDFSNISVQAENILAYPFYFLILFFIIFTFVVSAVFYYHWKNFNLGDKFIKNYILVYFTGLSLLLLPLLYTLIK